MYFFCVGVYYFSSLQTPQKKNQPHPHPVGFLENTPGKGEKPTRSRGREVGKTNNLLQKEDYVTIKIDQ